jgi:hypothetical protein
MSKGPGIGGSAPAGGCCGIGAKPPLRAAAPFPRLGCPPPKRSCPKSLRSNRSGSARGPPPATGWGGDFSSGSSAPSGFGTTTCPEQVGQLTTVPALRRAIPIS